MKRIIAILAVLLCAPAQARDDGRYANSPLKPWFDGLYSTYGLCCSFADGRAIDDPDIDMSGQHCHEAICVRVDGQWLDVPDKAIVKAPNKFGPAVVWPSVIATQDGSGPGVAYVRCFLPGAGA